MATDPSKNLRTFSILLVSLPILFIALFVRQFVSIQLRLSRNGKIAHQLVESLEARFPASEFGGGASYESEVIYIHVRNHVAETKRQDIEAWLREQKIEQKIAPQILLRFYQDAGDNDIIIK